MKIAKYHRKTNLFIEYLGASIMIIAAIGLVVLLIKDIMSNGSFGLEITNDVILMFIGAVFGMCMSSFAGIERKIEDMKK